MTCTIVGLLAAVSLSGNPTYSQDVLSSGNGARIGGIAETPEEALDADLREAALMLKQKQFRMLAHDFLPSFMAMRLEYNAGRKRVESSPHVMSDQDVADLSSHLKAALTGKRLFNRNKTLVEITYIRKPVELIPASSPTHVPTTSDTPRGRIRGLGPNLPEMLNKATRLLESGKTEEFIQNVYPLPELARLTEGVGLRRYAHRMSSTSSMVEAMIRDLKAAAAGNLEISGREAQVSLPPLVKGDPQRMLKFEQIDGHWRFFDSERQNRTLHRKLMTAEVGSVSIPENRGVMMLTRTGGSWRLVSMPVTETTK